MSSLTKRRVTPPSSTSPSTPSTSKNEGYRYEFGGPVGAAGLMVFSHFILYYVYYTINFNNGSLFLPTSLAEVKEAFATLCAACAPTWRSTIIYLGFIFVEVIFAYLMPGIKLNGRPDDTGKVLSYFCNAYSCWWTTLAIIFGLQMSGIFNLGEVAQNIGSFMTVAVIWADFLSMCIYASAFLFKLTHRMSGNHLYDFFMGAILHPRIGKLDIKMFAEIRLSWFLLFLLTTSCAVDGFHINGSINFSALFIVFAHFLYANACAKGEHYVPPTWDIFYEKFGWMLCFWNFAGVPFLYCAQAMYIRKLSPQLPPAYLLGLLVVLLAAYYVWDTSQGQKNHFRLQSTGVVVKRRTFPYLPWQIIDKKLEDISVVRTKRGTPLLTDGWWKYARKIHYTADIFMAFSWGACCGFAHFIPFFYVCFFTGMIIHRYFRDMESCSRKYGEDWQVYIKKVPHAFIPGLI